MDHKTYLWLKWLIIAAVLIVIRYGVWQHNVIPVLLSTGLGIVSILILRVKTRTFLVDERAEHIADRAARGVFSLSVLSFGLVSLVFLATSRRGMLFPEALGTLFGYVAIFMLALYLLLYWIYNIQMGGRDEEQD